MRRECRHGQAQIAGCSNEPCQGAKAGRSQSAIVRHAHRTQKVGPTTDKIAAATAEGGVRRALIGTFQIPIFPKGFQNSE
jgi:hypothetical protein